MQVHAKNLIVFTAGFPFGNSETTFLQPELVFLSEKFQKIYLVPINHKSTRNSAILPDNVEVWQDIFAGKNSGQRTFFEYVFVIGLFLKEFAYLRDYRLIKNAKYHISELFVYLDISKSLESLFSDRKLSEENYIFYTYWLDVWASAFSIFKLRTGKKIEFLSRAHGFDLYDERSERGYIFPRRLQLSGIKKVFSISKSGAEYLRRKFSNFAEKIDYSRLGTIKKFGEPDFSDVPSEILVVSCSTVSHVKRVHKIAEILAQSKKNVKWVHFGDGPLRERVESLANKLPSNVVVDFKGNVENSVITKFYSENYVHWFINISESEGIPVSIMEAISYGIPVIAPNVGGISEIVNDTTGKLIDKEPDPAAVAGMIENSQFSSQQRQEIIGFWKKNYNAETNFTEFAEKLRGTNKQTLY